MTVIAMKDFGISYLAGLYLFKPISIFSFLLLVRSIWYIAVNEFLLSGPKLDNPEIEKIIGKEGEV
jgi:hypothetical protein